MGVILQKMIRPLCSFSCLIAVIFVAGVTSDDAIMETKRDNKYLIKTGEKGRTNNNGFNSRCQGDCIDMQSCPDGEYRYIMVYQDHLTKFTILEAMKTKEAVEVAGNLVKIFKTFSAP